jgi:hypothetical protein
MMHTVFNRLSLGLGLSCTIMVIVLGAEIATGNGMEASPEIDVMSTNIEASTATVPNHVPQSFDSFAEILERPLFYADRQLPPEPKQQAVAAVPQEPLRLKLEGVAIMDESRIALLRSQGDNALLQMAEGMTYNGWTLELVLADKAVFKRGNDSAEIELETDTGPRRRR